jgi:phosphatidate cytidylyltransferase
MADRPSRPPRARSGAGTRGSQGAPARRRPPPADQRRRRPAPPPRPKRQRSDLLSRVLIAVPAAAVAIVFIYAGGASWAVLMFALGCVCMRELYTMLERWRPVPIVGFIALAGMIAAAEYGGPKQVLLAAAAAVPLLFLFVVARPQRGGATVAIAGTLLGIYWIGLAFSSAVLLRQLPHGGGIVLDVALGTFLGDTAAYLGGRAFGRRPLAPSISPNKTVEGLICGALIAMVAVISAGLYQPWLTQGKGLLLGISVAVLGPIGDLFESLVKRDAGAKDAGTLFGAHGGALDRLDAVMFTIVAGYFVWLAVVH